MLIAGLGFGEADEQRWIAVKFSDETFAGGIVQIFDSLHDPVHEGFRTTSVGEVSQTSAEEVAPNSMRWAEFSQLVQQGVVAERSVQGVLIRRPRRRARRSQTHKPVQGLVEQQEAADHEDARDHRGPLRPHGLHEDDRLMNEPTDAPGEEMQVDEDPKVGPTVESISRLVHLLDHGIVPSNRPEEVDAPTVGDEPMGEEVDALGRRLAHAVTLRHRQPRGEQAADGSQS